MIVLINKDNDMDNAKSKKKNSYNICVHLCKQIYILKINKVFFVFIDTKNCTSLF